MKRSTRERWGQVEDRLSCSGCSYPLDDQLYCCTKGHLYCEVCLFELGTCIVCKGREPPKIDSRNMMIEEVIRSIEYPCQWVDCSFKSTLFQVVEHEKTCSFRRYFCLLCRDGATFSKDDLAVHSNKHMAPLTRKSAQIKFNLPKTVPFDLCKTLVLRSHVLLFRCQCLEKAAGGTYYCQILTEGEFVVDVNGVKTTLSGWSPKRLESRLKGSETSVVLRLVIACI